MTGGDISDFVIPDDLTDEQIELIVGLSRRIAFSMKKPERKSDAEEGDTTIEDYFKRMGVNSQMFEKMKIALSDGGLKSEKIIPTMTGMIRVVQTFNLDGGSFEIDSGMREYFENRIGLSQTQIEIVQRLSKRIANGLKNSDRTENR